MTPSSVHVPDPAGARWISKSDTPEATPPLSGSPLSVQAIVSWPSALSAGVAEIPVGTFGAVASTMMGRETSDIGPSHPAASTAATRYQYCPSPTASVVEFV